MFISFVFFFFLTFLLCSFSHKQTGECREVSHYLYMSWPDFGVPKSASAMLDFRAEVKQRQELALRTIFPDWTGPPGGPPIVVHCSAGIGRTGRFM